MRYSFLLVAVALVALPAASAAQIPADSLIAGDLVQYRLSGPLHDLPDESKATFEALTFSGVVVSTVEGFDASGSVELPRELIDGFEVARGTKDIRWPGAVVVGAAGCAVGYAVVKAGNSEDHEGGMFLGCPLGILVGGVLGYFVGSKITGPKWTDVEFE